MIENKFEIIGAGGGKDGGGGGRVAQEDKDSLQSISYAQIIDLISEGEIEGLVDGPKSIYLNDTPLLDSNGNPNFSGVVADFRPGSQAQDVITGFSTSENEVSVATEVKYATPVVRTIVSSNVDAVNVRISIPQLTNQDQSTGDLHGSEVTFAIETNSASAGWVQRANDTIIGKCVSKYVKSYRVDLPATGPHQVRVRRVTLDSTSSAIQNKTIWDSYGEVIDAKFTYPNSALVAIKVDASNFQSIPKRSYDVKLLKVRVPDNYNTFSRTYSGIWTGTFRIAWTDNPAWIFYDLVTNTRYGLGANIDPSLIDKWGLYKIAQYCDEMVLDGFGGTEPRFTCNCYFQTRAEAYNLIQDLASVFRSIAYWSSGLLTLSQDSPQDAAHLFTPANVIGGEFQYQGTSKKDRFTVAMVTWVDPDSMFTQKVEYVEDPDSIAKYGVIQKEIVAFGCTSRGQAHRFGKWLIYASQNETETVTFQTGIEAAVVRPGQIIKIQDPMRAGVRFGGRINSGTTTTVVIDQDVVMTGPLTLSVMLPDGTVSERAIASIIGRVVTIGTAFPMAPANQAIWMLTSSVLTPQTFRVVAVAEESGQYSVTAIMHNPNKYAHIESNLVLETRNISTLSITPDAPVGLKVVESLYEVNGEVRVKATFSWDPSPNAGSYAASYKPLNGNLVSLGEVRANEVEILNIDAGTFDFYVTAISPLQKQSSRSAFNYTVLGKSYPPGDVTGFSLIPMSNVAFLTWDITQDLDVAIGGHVRIRYSPNTGAAWKDSVDVAILAGNSTKASVPLMNGTYLAKFIDSGGNVSNNPATIQTTALEASVLNVVQTITESPTFPGTKTGMVVEPFYGGLALDATMLIDDWASGIDSLLAIDYIGTVTSLGEYLFSNNADLGAVYTCNLTAKIKVAAVDVGDTIDMRQDPVDKWLDIDGAFIDDVNATIYVSTTLGNPASGGSTWTEWKPFFVGSYTARGLKFKVVATSGSSNHAIVISELAVSLDLPDRTVNIAGVLSSTSGSVVAFEKPFSAIPAVGITAHNMSSGDYYTITGKTASGFTITFYNSSNTPIARTFDVIAKGYGRAI